MRELKPCPRCSGVVEAGLRSGDGKPQVRCKTPGCLLALTIEDDSASQLNLSEQVEALRQMWNDKICESITPIEVKH